MEWTVIGYSVLKIESGFKSNFMLNCLSILNSNLFFYNKVWYISLTLKRSNIEHASLWLSFMLISKVLDLFTTLSYANKNFLSSTKRCKPSFVIRFFKVFY